jgi:hypothetical protein
MAINGKTFVKLGLVGACLTGMVGCFGYRDVVDPYYPKRYSVQARNGVRNSVAPQVRNGEILDQTVWNYHFMDDTADLHPMGAEHLKRLARKRPAPCSVIFLQTAQLNTAQGDTELKDLGHKRKQLDQKRSEKIMEFMNTYMEGREHEPFQVVIHDPAEVYGNGRVAERIINLRLNTYTGGLTGSNPTGTSAGGQSNNSDTSNGSNGSNGNTSATNMSGTSNGFQDFENQSRDSKIRYLESRLSSIESRSK